MSNPHASYIDELRAKYPQVHAEVFDVMDDRDRVDRELSELRFALAALCGWYERDSAIPVDKIRALLDGAR